LTLVVAFIPVDREDLDESQRAVSTGETIVAAQKLLADLAGFCDRNPDTCVTGKDLFAQFGAKAMTGAREIIAYLGEGQPAETEKPAEDGSDLVSTGSVKADR
ncbi:MAG: DUF5330 domain-containing protein, partial [Nitratireductor sp.]|nr:DUF5330 domain-containing protein [Nitratireductor sp.]